MGPRARPANASRQNVSERHDFLRNPLQKVPAKAKRFGKDPFTGEERWFPAKPASVKVKVRPLKKLKDAAQ
jgi:hypothetical protein